MWERSKAILEAGEWHAGPPPSVRRRPRQPRRIGTAGQPLERDSGAAERDDGAVRHVAGQGEQRVIGRAGRLLR